MRNYVTHNTTEPRAGGIDDSFASQVHALVNACQLLRDGRQDVAINSDVGNRITGAQLADCLRRDQKPQCPI
jgi:hypothetical protein